MATTTKKDWDNMSHDERQKRTDRCTECGAVIKEEITIFGALQSRSCDDCSDYDTDGNLKK